MQFFAGPRCFHCLTSQKFDFVLTSNLNIKERWLQMDKTALYANTHTHALNVSSLDLIQYLHI